VTYEQKSRPLLNKMAAIVGLAPLPKPVPVIVTVDPAAPLVTLRLITVIVELCVATVFVSIPGLWTIPPIPWVPTGGTYLLVKVIKM
jgi:hypothetical protein